MENENRCPTLESLLQNMIANQQSMHETFEEFNDRLKRIEEKIESLDDYQTMEVEEEEGGDEELYEAVKGAVIEAGRASTSYIQRTFKIGYSRAAALLDKLEMNGVVGPQDGSKPREVFSQD
jgi:DNA segregation ATPase FtsK/SpoIIIE-like protein